MNQHLDFEIIWRKIHGTLSEKDEEKFHQWLSSSPSHRKFFENASRYYAHGTQFENTHSDLKRAYRRVSVKTGILRPYYKASIVIATAGVAASILLFFYFSFFQLNQDFPVIAEQEVQSIVPGTDKAILVLDNGTALDLSSDSVSVLDVNGAKIRNNGKQLEYAVKSSASRKIEFNTLKVPRGGEYFLVLADSTKVWLNSETTLRFPVQFIGDTRQVELTGEAYFEVAENRHMPFIVVSGNQEVKVLGTQFNISSYPEDNVIRTTLVQGRVELSISDKPEEILVLNPGEQSLLADSEMHFEKREVDIRPYIAWKDGLFKFQGQSLEEIAKTLSRWYNVELQFDNQDLKQLRFVGTIPRYSDFNSVIAKIERTNEVEFEIKDKLIIIK